MQKSDLELPSLFGPKRVTETQIYPSCGAQKFNPALRSLLFQAIFMMQAAENGRRGNAVAGGKFMSVEADRDGRLNRFRNAWPERGMRTAAIVMNGELGEGSSQMAFIDRNQVIEALASNRSDQPFAV